MIDFPYQHAPEFDMDSLKRNYGVNFMIWRLIASAYSSRNLLILTTADDRLSISTCPPSLIQILWKGIMESTSWFDGFSLLHTRPQLVDFDYWRWYAPLSLIQILWKETMEQASIVFVDCPSVWSCLTSVLGFKCSVCMKIGWLFAKIAFSCGIFGISKPLQTEKSFWLPNRVMSHQCFRLWVFAGKGWLFAKIIFM